MKSKYYLKEKKNGKWVTVDTHYNKDKLQISLERMQVVDPTRILKIQ
jgi:hypothetical protein